jgi:hypothetical protein
MDIWDIEIGRHLISSFQEYPIGFRAEVDDSLWLGFAAPTTMKINTTMQSIVV